MFPALYDIINLDCSYDFNSSARIFLIFNILRSTLLTEGDDSVFCLFSFLKFLKFMISPFDSFEEQSLNAKRIV